MSLKHKTHSTTFHQFVCSPQMKPILSTRAFGPSYSAGWIVTWHVSNTKMSTLGVAWQQFRVEATSGGWSTVFQPLKNPCQLPKRASFFGCVKQKTYGHRCKAWEWFLSDLKHGPPFCWSKCLCKPRTWHSLQLVGYGSWSHGLLNKCNNTSVGFHPLHSKSSSSKNVTVYSL